MAKLTRKQPGVYCQPQSPKPLLMLLPNSRAAACAPEQAASVRQQCSGILLQFLLDYPLGARRLAHHLNFLVANFGYEHETGREAALAMTQARRLPLPLSLSGFPSLPALSARCQPLCWGFG